MEKAVLIELLNQGLSTRSIARELGSSQTNVRYWLKKYGLKSPPRQHATNPAPAISRREVRRLEERVRELERLLGRKTMEVEILKAALDLARAKKPTLLSHSPLRGDIR